MTACHDLMCDLGGLQGLPAACSAPGGLQRGSSRCGGWMGGLPLLLSLPAAPFLLGHRTEPGNDVAQSSSSKSSIDTRQWHGAPWTRATTQPGWAHCGHKATLPAAEIYSSFFHAAGRSPGSPWELDDVGQCCSLSHLQHGCAAAAYGHVVKHRERMGTCVWGCSPACESLPGK